MDPANSRAAAAKKDLLRPEVKAGQIVAWLKEGCDLGYVHATALYGTLMPHLGKAWVHRSSFSMLRERSIQLVPSDESNRPRASGFDSRAGVR
jgi:hypothetical protein